MPYDPPTLWLLVVFVTVVMTGVLLLSRITIPGAGGPLTCWAGAMALTGMGIAGIASRGHIADFISIELSNAALLLAAGLLWLGVRRLDRRTPAYWPLAVAPLAWIAACELPVFAHSVGNRILLSAALLIPVLGWTMRELLRVELAGRPARRIAVIVLAAQAALLASRFVVVPLSDLDRIDRFALLSDPLVGLYALAGLAFVVLLGFVMLALVREERERAFRQASMMDDLTALLNRRGFLETAEGACTPGLNFAVLALDLDRFKQVNDLHGHAAGDALLVLFGEVMRAELGAGDVVARMGGEEFGVLLPDASLEQARMAAERIRAAFRGASSALGLAGVNGTVSIGIAAGTVPAEGIRNALGPALARADAALYRAKALGRDRVEALAATARIEAMRAAG